MQSQSQLKSYYAKARKENRPFVETYLKDGKPFAGRLLENLGTMSKIVGYVGKQVKIFTINNKEIF
jgi:hypothetical protein